MESVEDEWERELESDVDLDLLFVTYDPQKVTAEELRDTIAEYDFDVEIPNQDQDQEGSIGDE